MPARVRCRTATANDEPAPYKAPCHSSFSPRHRPCGGPQGGLTTDHWPERGATPHLFVICHCMLPYRLKLNWNTSIEFI
ncbi:hypothetical protein J6590_024037 [Homalodisca vitripennis]|nr:hypothetical protein J6590_024037 [Homalodisca vitripennis]